MLCNLYLGTSINGLMFQWCWTSDTLSFASSHHFWKLTSALVSIHIWVRNLTVSTSFEKPGLYSFLFIFVIPRWWNLDIKSCDIVLFTFLGVTLLLQLPLQFICERGSSQNLLPSVESQILASEQAEVHVDASVVREKSKIQQGFFWGSTVCNTS